MQPSGKKVLGRRSCRLFPLRDFVFLALAIACTVGAVSAQSTYGTLLGTVTDSAGAVIGGANVVAVNAPAIGLPSAPVGIRTTSSLRSQCR